MTCTISPLRVANAQDAVPAHETQLELAVRKAAEALVACQNDDGHWAFELEAGAFVPAKYVMLRHYLGEPGNDVLESKIARYLRSLCCADGGWPTYQGGAFDLSSSVKAYYALKLCGEPIDSPLMTRARRAILAAGGAKEADVFTRLQLALFEQVPWQAVPVMPVEIMALPNWFPFHLSKVANWSRLFIVPMLVLMALKPKARNPRRIQVRELFVEPPETVRDWYDCSRRGFWPCVFRALDRVLQPLQARFPKRFRQRCIDQAVRWISERLNGENGLGAIYPPMASAVMMYDALGYAEDFPARATARAAIEKLLVTRQGMTYCQPCVSPVWDTALASQALLELGGEASAQARRGLDWLLERQILDFRGDWAAVRPGLRPGGWPFQYGNDYYPDVDDTAVVAMAMARADHEAKSDRYRQAISRAVEWVIGMQSKNGGWGAFDADNTNYALNAIPFADHGEMLDPPTADVSARCLSMLMQLGCGREHPSVRAALAYLLQTQEADGAWFGRWGANYLYGTWSVLCALKAVGLERQHPAVSKALAWLKSKQRADGGWGESCASYWPGEPRGEGPVSTASQSAWALLGLMAYEPADDPAIERGARFLMETQNDSGLWEEAEYTACGFPKIFYMRYHGYPAYFPLWALARYRNRLDVNESTKIFGM